MTVRVANEGVLEVHGVNVVLRCDTVDEDVVTTFGNT
jgi:hypothetical protein